MKRVQVSIFVFVSLFVSLILVGAQDVTPETSTTRQPGDSRTDQHGIEQVWIPPGCFLVGTSAEQASTLQPPSWAERELTSEQPQHEVCLSQGYWIDKYEVTNAAYQAFVDGGGYLDETYWSEDGLAWLQRQNVDELPVECPGETEPDHPHVCVTWYEAEAYARWRGGRLPTEAEWEFAARGPESLVYPWGDKWDETKANVVGLDSTTAVGSYPNGASWVGALDMAGNVMEWVSDLDYDYYQLEVRDDPQGAESGRQKIEKGGWWGSNPFVARSAYRHFEDPPNYQDHHIGIRIVSPSQ